MLRVSFYGLNSTLLYEKVGRNTIKVGRNIGMVGRKMLSLQKILADENRIGKRIRMFDSYFTAILRVFVP